MLELKLMKLFNFSDFSHRRSLGKSLNILILKSSLDLSNLSLEILANS
jgi:hypothetical protein